MTDNTESKPTVCGIRCRLTHHQAAIMRTAAGAHLAYYGSAALDFHLLHYPTIWAVCITAVLVLVLDKH